MKKIVISVILLFSVLLFYTTYASSFNFSAEPDQATVNPGDEISITLKISNIDAGTEGINVVETNLTYDKSIIEGISFVEKTIGNQHIIQTKEIYMENYFTLKWFLE